MHGGQRGQASGKEKGKEKGTSLIFRKFSGSAGAAKGELKAKPLYRLLQPIFGAERAAALDAGSYRVELLLVQPAVDPGNPIPRPLYRPGGQRQLKLQPLLCPSP